jgi:hypothetical protein
MQRILSWLTTAVIFIALLFGIATKPLGGSNRTPPTNNATVFFENAWRTIKIALFSFALDVHGWLQDRHFAAPLKLCLATAARNTDERPGEFLCLPMAAGKIIYKGTIVAIDALGNANPGANTVGLVVMGLAHETVDNSAGDAGDLTINVKRGVFKLANSAGSALTAAYVGTIAMVEDDETVATAASNSIKAGLVVEVESDGVWIDTRAFLPVVGTVANAAITAAKLADAVADLIRTTTVAVANTGTPDGVAHITGQVKDAQGNALAGRHLVQVFLSATSYGNPTDLGTLTALANSVLIKEVTDDAIGLVVTHTDGSWGLELDLAADGNVYAHAVVLGLHVVANAAITGN